MHSRVKDRCDSIEYLLNRGRKRSFGRRGCLAQLLSQLQPQPLHSLTSISRHLQPNQGAFNLSDPLQQARDAVTPALDSAVHQERSPLLVITPVCVCVCVCVRVCACACVCVRVCVCDACINLQLHRAVDSDD